LIATGEMETARNPHPAGVTPEMNRRNGRIFFLSTVGYYLAGTVLYVGVVQAALCDRLGASPVMANLPAACYGFGSILPVILFPLIPYRLERAAVVLSNCLLTLGLVFVCTTLLLPFPNSVRIVAVVAQGMITGLSLSVSNVYMFQCLGRGTTVEGRARTLRLSYSVGPICAVGASLGAQFVLTRAMPYRFAFALIFLLGIPCTAGITLLSSRYDLIWIEETKRTHLVQFFRGAVKTFGRDRRLVLLWACYFLWTVSYNTEPNISLHIKQVLNKPPQAFSGVLLFLRFGCKSLAGFAIGWLALRRGIRSPVVASLALTGAAILWACFVPGNLYLAAFGFAGAGELATVYLTNYAISISPPEFGASNLSLLSVAFAMGGFGPLVYGALAQTRGFGLSILAGIVPLLAALWIVSRLPPRELPDSAMSSSSA
jgi:MFS family permease